jgi:demethylmenaquinone methyltransferase/2-methoxy-6-polyprenyl-1,4-benzoquinol methylase
MFAAIAPRYDFLNHLLSLSVDRYWRRRVVRVLAGHDPSPPDRCLDLCTGTGDLALDIHRRLGIETFGVDFCHPMLVRLAAKLRSGDLVRVVEADCQALPFPDQSFRFVTIAFGLRNVENRVRALREMHRVIAPGGVLVVLEFSRPVVPGLRGLFDVYFRRVLPWLGSRISGTRGPYAYLPDSVRRFPDQPALAAELRGAGWMEVGYRNLTSGIAALHWASRPLAGAAPPRSANR